MQRIVFTVDPSSARDLDDAISVANESETQWIIGVHIADVSKYVTPGSELDVHAQLNMTSTYLPRAVHPMLPEHLSNGLCSLTPGEEKDVLSVYWRVNKETDKRGEPWFSRDKIIVDKRFSYEECEAEIDSFDDGQKCPIDSFDIKQAEMDTFDVKQALWVVFNHHMLIRRKFGPKWLSMERQQAIDFVFDRDEIIGVVPHHQLQSMRMIETWMVEANCAAANFIKNNCPADQVVVRQHENFRQDKAKLITVHLRNSGHCGLSMTSKESFLDTMKKFTCDDETKRRIKSCACMALSKAHYFTLQDCSDREIEHSHWSLHREIYTHFTSPIRRYPDILVHRAIINILEGQPNKSVVSDGDCVSQLCELANAKMTEATKKERAAVTNELIGLLRKRIIPSKVRVFVTSITKTTDGKKAFIGIQTVGDIGIDIRPLMVSLEFGSTVRPDGNIQMVHFGKRFLVKLLTELEVELQPGRDVIFARIPKV